METISPRKQPRRVSIRCTQCGSTDEINDRSYRRKVAEGKPHLCRLCRKMAAITASEADIKFWRDRMSQEEIDAMISVMRG